MDLAFSMFSSIIDSENVCKGVEGGKLRIEKEEREEEVFEKEKQLTTGVF